MDFSGAVFVADYNNNLIRKISFDGKDMNWIIAHIIRGTCFIKELLTYPFVVVATLIHAYAFRSG